MLATIAVLACDQRAAFDGLCTAVDPHDPTHLAGPIIERLVGPLLVLIGLYAGGRLTRRMASRAVRRAGGDPQVRALVHNVITVFTIVLAGLAALVVAGLDLSILLAFGGLTSLAIGLAFQDLLRNVLAGMFLLLERPFRIGDLVKVGDNQGVVQTITLRTTALRTIDGELAILPNLSAFAGTVINRSAFPQRRYSLFLRVPADVPTSDLVDAVVEVLRKVETISRAPTPTVVPETPADGPLRLACHYWLDYRREDVEAVQSEVASRLWAVVAEMAPPPSD